MKLVGIKVIRVYEVEVEDDWSPFVDRKGVAQAAMMREAIRGDVGVKELHEHRIYEYVGGQSGAGMSNRVKALEAFVQDFADEPCEYGDNCSPFIGARHGQCKSCRAREILDQPAEPS